MNKSEAFDLAYMAKIFFDGVKDCSDPGTICNTMSLHLETMLRTYPKMLEDFQYFDGCEDILDELCIPYIKLV